MRLLPSLLLLPGLATSPHWFQEDSPISAAIERADAALAAIESRPPDQRTFANTVRALDDVQARFFNEARWPGFLSQVSPDGEERARGRRAALDLSNWFDRLYKREALFAAVRDVAGNVGGLAGEDARYLERVLREFRRNGMELKREDRERLAAIDEELAALGIEFRRNIDEDETSVLLTPEECRGVAEEFLATLPRVGDLIDVPMTSSVARRFWSSCEVESTREKLVVAYSNRGGQRNVEILEKLLRLRSEKAHLLGYSNFAEYVLETRMAKRPDVVEAFYEDLRPKLRRKALADFAEFEAAKRQHTADPQAELHAWDYRFYKTWLLRERYAVDREVVREYFPVERVIDGIFELAQELFGLRFSDVSAAAAEKGRLLWHEDVRLFEVWDRQTGELLGEFYTDLHPRPGKYSHAAQFPIVLRKRWADGTLTRPVVALVCNFTKPTPEKPSLLSHDEVETFFHEFGHCLHSILSEASYAEFAGTSVARDFVEAPSQMLENWVWDAGVLARFARHYATGEPLPQDVLAGMVAAKNLGSGLETEGQVFLGMLDFAYHSDSDGEVDTTRVRQEVYERTRLFEPLPIHGQSSFGHLVGYEAGYYGYLWSLVYAQDMFSRFEQEGLLNPQLGREYRQTVLAPGDTVDALELVRRFLGREPNSDAFLRHLGLSQGR